jgi:hypothetical protein
MDAEWALNANAVCRGVQRMLYAAGYASISEFILPDGSRLDIAAIGTGGDLLAVEIKVALADLRGDRKWPGYLDYCERFYFAVPVGALVDHVPPECGLIVADRYGAEIVRQSAVQPMTAARRKALTLSFARVAAGRLQRGLDPEAALLPF